METQQLLAEIRNERGKGAARRLRNAGKLPAVVYGKEQEPVSLSVSPVDLRKILSTAYGRNVLINLSIEGSEQMAMTKALQVDPVTRQLIHLDLVRIDPEQPVLVRVPFKTTGRCKGVVEGGEINVVYRDIPVRAKPADIPLSIESDITELNINDLLRARELSLPPGVEVLLSPEQTVVAVITERKQDELEAAQPGAEADEAAEGEKSEGEAKAEETAGAEKKKPEKGDSKK